MKPVFMLHVAALAALFACEERINIRVRESAPGLVVYGYVTTDTMAHAVRISRSSGYFAETPPEGIAGASVSITIAGQKYELVESASEQGLYLTAPDVYGLVGEICTLRVSVDFLGNGRTELFEAVSELPPAPTVDSVAFATLPGFERFLAVLGWGRLPETGATNYFNSHLYINGVLYNDSLSNFMIDDDRFFDASQEINGIPLFFLNRDERYGKLRQGDTVTVQLDGITPEYADFLNNIRRETTGTAPLFAGPPANVRSNIRCLSEGSTTLVLGFFTAYSKNAKSAVFVGD
jgi:hypothetical protein